mgnify:FL=1
MSSSTFIDLRVNNAEQFKNSVTGTPNTKMFLVFGKIDSWANDLSPDIANTSMNMMYEVWDNMIGGKRILGGDMYHVIPRHNWSSNTVYTAYDDKSTTLYDSNTIFYVMNSTYSVYKCIANNYGKVSTIEPTSVNPEIVSTTGDGYSWKYMYTVSDSEKLRFVTDAYIPVKTLTGDDGSLQWQVQNTAISGAINNIVVTNSGNNYTNVSNISIVITGDGSSASAIPTVNTTTNTISSIVITDSGKNYTYATVSITDKGLGAGANARAIISPFNGHGTNPVYELGGKNILINAKLRYTEEGVLPVGNDYRQIAILKDPYYYNTEIPASNLAFVQALTLVCDGVGDFQSDEIVYQGTNFAQSSFSGKVVSWDSTTSKLLLINTKGTPTISQSVIGVTSFTTRVVTNYTNGTMKKFSGRLLYVDNIKPITRATDQIENFQILLKF